MVESPRQGKYGQYLTAIMAVSDLIIFNLAFLVALHLAPWGDGGARLRMLWLLVNVAYIPVAFRRRKIMRSRSIFMEHVVTNSLVAVMLHALVFLALLSFLQTDDISWPTIADFYIIVILALPAWWILSRLAVKHFRKRGKNFVRVVIAGTGPTALRLHSELTDDSAYGYRVIGFIGPRPDTPLPAPWLGEISSVNDILADRPVDEVYSAVIGDNEPEADITAVAEATDRHFVRLYYVPQILHNVTRSFSLGKVGPMPVLTQMPNPLQNVFRRGLKRGFDIAVSSAFLVVSPLIFLPIAACIKLSSPGPVFFTQIRTGYRGHPFRCRKFRTMRVNSDADSLQATPDDPRTTAVGKFLRRTNLDELPQFINVLLGDMSLVGPRPHMLVHTQVYSEIVDRYMVRHKVKPGITGWAQVNGFRGVTDELWKMERRVEHDVWYVENWSFALDLKIIARTLLNAFHGEENAY